MKEKFIILIFYSKIGLIGGYWALPLAKFNKSRVVFLSLLFSLKNFYSSSYNFGE